MVKGLTENVQKNICANGLNSLTAIRQNNPQQYYSPQRSSSANSRKNRRRWGDS